MIDIIKLGIVLTIISVVAALAIAFTNSKTKDRILFQQQLAEQTALQEIMPEGVSISEKKGTCQTCPEKYWVGSNGDDTVFAFRISSRGYSSEIVYLVGMKTDGSIAGLTILEQGETPGLGSRVQEVISKNYFWNGLFGKKEAGPPWFTTQFEGININNEIKIDKSMGEWHTLGSDEQASLQAQNAITSITGSTISTKAVIRGLEQQARTYLKAIQGK